MTIKKEPAQYFKTSDLLITSYLIYSGYTLEQIDRANKSKAVFCVLRDKNIDQIIEDYWQKKLLVEPIAFFNTIKEIKSRLYN